MSRNVLRELAKIRLVLARTRLSKLEQERAARNLEAVRERLVNHDYLRASYAENKFNIPERLRDFFIELEFYSGLGRLWQAIFEKLDLKKIKSVIDLCPGSFPKVELGLLYAGYTGRVVILDADREALASARKFLTLFDPPFSVRAAPAVLQSYKGKRFDLITANHVLDDLAMHHGCRKARLSLSEVYEKEENLLRLWQCILQNSGEIGANVVKTLSCAIERLSQKKATIILTQYPSYVERSLKLKEVSAFNCALLDDLSDALVKKGFTMDPAFCFSAPEKVPLIFKSSDCRLIKRV